MNCSSDINIFLFIKVVWYYLHSRSPSLLNFIFIYHPIQTFNNTHFYTQPIIPLNSHGWPSKSYVFVAIIVAIKKCYILNLFLMCDLVSLLFLSYNSWEDKLCSDIFRRRSHLTLVTYYLLIILISWELFIRHKWPDVLLFQKRYKHFVALVKKLLLYCTTTDLVLQ